MIIDSSGRLLSGTTTEGHADADDLTLQAPSGYTGITLEAEPLPEEQFISPMQQVVVERLMVRLFIAQNSRTMTFATAGVTKLTLKSDGLLVPKVFRLVQMLHQHPVMVLRCLLRPLQVVKFKHMIEIILNGMI